MSVFPSLQSEIDYIQHSTDVSDECQSSSALSSKSTSRLSLETLHPDDAKDKVFVAILKALLVLDNKPSSPKELANCIMNHKFTLLGGATPYATVSSRISQHFKRAMEHKPPRTPLLARIVDENHSRKIHYYIANEAVKSDLNRLTPIPSPQPTLKPLKEFASVEGGYPKLKIRLKKRKNSMIGNHVFKRYKTIFSGARPGMGRGKGKWAPHTHYRSSNRVSHPNSSGSGSDADIDEIDSDSSKESASNDNVEELSMVDCEHPTLYPDATAEHDETNQSPRELLLDGEYSDYFEEMMNGDWCIDNCDADTLSTKQDPNTLSSSQPAQSNLTNKPICERSIPTTSTASTASTHTPTHKRCELELGPETTSLFGREFDSPLIPNFGDEFMELNDPEMIPTSELDELLNGSPRKYDIVSQRISSNGLGHSEIHGHQNSSHEGAVARADTSLMDVDSEARNTTIPNKQAKEETIDGTYSMALVTQERTPMVITKVYSNIKVYETVLPETPFRLMRFHSNVTPQNDPKNHGIILEESRHKDFCNASLLRKAAQLYVNQGKSERNDEYTRFVVIRNGPPECRGVWVSLERARKLVEEYGMQDVPHIQQLLSSDPLSGHHESMYDPIEMDKHLVELSGILGNTVSDYSFSQESNQNNGNSNAQPGHTSVIDSCIEENIEDIDTDTYISLDQDDEEANLPSKTNDDLIPSTSTMCSSSKSDGPTEDKLKKSLIPTQTPTTPAIYLTVIESVPVYVTYLSQGLNNDETIQLMRRFDSGYVNGTKLLMLGGVETESERTIVLSLEVGRVRVRREESKLFGTWIPLPRARALASTCSLQHKLGPFLDDKLSTYFANPLPSFTNITKPMGLTSRLHQVLKAKASTFPTRSTIGSSIGISPQSLHPSKNLFSGPNHHIYQILGLQSSKQSKGAALSGIFGGPAVVVSHDDKKWTKKVKSRFANGKRGLKVSRGMSGDRTGHLKAPLSSTFEATRTKDETESDIEVEEVRKTIQVQRLSDPESLFTNQLEQTIATQFSKADIGGNKDD